MLSVEKLLRKRGTLHVPPEDIRDSFRKRLSFLLAMRFPSSTGRRGRGRGRGRGRNSRSTEEVQAFGKLLIRKLIFFKK